MGQRRAAHGTFLDAKLLVQIISGPILLYRGIHGQQHFYRYSCGGRGNCSGARAALRTVDMHDLGVFGGSDSDSSLDGE